MSVGRAPEAYQGRIRPADEVAAEEAAKRKPPVLVPPEQLLKEIEAKKAEVEELDPRVAELEIAPDEELTELAESLELDFAELLDTNGQLIDRKGLLRLLVDNGASLTQTPRREPNK